MAILQFLLICKPCMEKYRDWENSTLCNVHMVGDGSAVLSCFNCGAEELFRPDQLSKTTKKDAILAREKAKILDELGKKDLKN